MIKRRYFLGMLFLCVVILSCSQPSTSTENSNNAPFLGTWTATYQYSSANLHYTITRTITFKSDRTFEETIFNKELNTSHVRTGTYTFDASQIFCDVKTETNGNLSTITFTYTINNNIFILDGENYTKSN